MTAQADPALMRRAIALARARMGTTWPNPTVGCVLARGDAVVGEGATGPGGRPHAEEQALDQAGEAARGATAYVTLEPCARRSGASVSCADRLIAAGVARVVAACEDPGPLASGQGAARMRAAGIVVETGLLEAEAAPLYAGYWRRLATGQPLVEVAEDGAGYDARFEPRPGESLEAALKRHGREGHTRLWTAPGGAAAKALSAQNLLR